MSTLINATIVAVDITLEVDRTSLVKRLQLYSLLIEFLHHVRVVINDMLSRDGR